mgnify:CR=1 FL=1
MSLSVKARSAIDAGAIDYVADEVVATVTYVDGTVPKEFLAHAFNSGKAYFEDVSADPWVRRAKACHAMRCGETLLAADDAICDVSSATNVGIDVLLRMREARMIKGLGTSIDAEG